MYRPRKLDLCSALACCFTAAVLQCGCARPHQGPYQHLASQRLGQIRMPHVERLTLKNGMRLLLVEDHELPLINLAAMVRTGSIYDPPEKIGLAEITAQVMRTGGTSRMTGDQIDGLLEQKAASVEVGMGLTAAHISASSLREDFNDVLSILADILREPAFSQEKIDLAKMQLRSAIARRNDDPGDVAAREFAKLVYGPDSPYARHPEYATIDRIEREDLVVFHKRFFGPNNIILAIWGDFQRDQMVRMVEEVFSDWAGVDVNIPRPPSVEYRYRPTVNLIKREDINQSNIIMGHLASRMDDPNYHALNIMERILGVGFTSRLFRNVRSRQGLAYSVYGRYECQFDHPGLFAVGCQTKSDMTVRAIRAMQQEVERITGSLVTDEELAVAKEAFLNAYVFNFESTGQIVRRLMAYDYYGYPADFLERLRQDVAKVTKQQILDAARTHLRPDAMQVLVVGRPQDFDQDLGTLGPVNQIDITIPQSQTQ